MLRGLSAAVRARVRRWWARLDDAARRELADDAEADEPNEPAAAGPQAPLRTPAGLADRIEGGLLGLLVGDALGVPYEFHDASRLPEPASIELEPPAWFRRSHRRVPPGTWSDDGAQALCLLASLLDRDAFDLEDFAARLVRWYEDGYMAVDGVVFDVGIQTKTALGYLACGVAPTRSGPAGERANGNGSLMRVLPLALWHRGDDRALVTDAMRSSLPTHRHLRSQLCCALYCLWIRRMLEGATAPEAWTAASAGVREHTSALDDAAVELSVIEPDAPARGRGSGYVVDCLHSSRLSLEAGTYEQAVRAAIALGDDTDTTAAVTGGAAGVREGVDAIPRRWRLALRGRGLLDPLLDRLLDRA